MVALRMHKSATPKGNTHSHASKRQRSSPTPSLLINPHATLYNTCQHATTNAQLGELGQVANRVGDTATQLVVGQQPVCTVDRATHCMCTGQQSPKATLTAPHLPCTHAPTLVAHTLTAHQPTHNWVSWVRLPIESGMLPVRPLRYNSLCAW